MIIVYILLAIIILMLINIIVQNGNNSKALQIINMQLDSANLRLNEIEALSSGINDAVDVLISTIADIQIDTSVIKNEVVIK